MNETTCIRRPTGIKAGSYPVSIILPRLVKIYDQKELFILNFCVGFESLTIETKILRQNLCLKIYSLYVRCTLFRFKNIVSFKCFVLSRAIRLCAYFMHVSLYTEANIKSTKLTYNTCITVYRTNLYTIRRKVYTQNIYCNLLTRLRLYVRFEYIRIY